MESAEDLRNRIRSTEKSAKITKTMKLVAAARARKAAENALAARPFVDTLRDTVIKLSERLDLEDTSDIPLLENRPVKKTALVVITGDRGLCGSYNSKILKKTQSRIQELSDLGIESEIYSIGSKGSRFFARRPTPVVKQVDCGALPSSEEAQAVVKEVVDRFLEGEVDRVELLYTAFTSMVSTTPSIRTMIPFSVSENGIEMEDDEIKTLTSRNGELSVEAVGTKSDSVPSLKAETVLEQGPEQLVNRMLPMYLNSGLLSAWQNSVASELGSRYTAMSAATDNANSLKDELEKQMNRLRQGAITQEISEIIAGSLAV
jgi:F-type H+-transporting ATPase subunit gamma